MKEFLFSCNFLFFSRKSSIQFFSHSTLQNWKKFASIESMNRNLHWSKEDFSSSSKVRLKTNKAIVSAAMKFTMSLKEAKVGSSKNIMADHWVSGLSCLLFDSWLSKWPSFDEEWNSIIIIIIIEQSKEGIEVELLKWVSEVYLLLFRD